VEAQAAPQRAKSVEDGEADEKVVTKKAPVSLHDLGYSDDEIAAILSSKEVSAIRSGANNDVADLKAIGKTLSDLRSYLRDCEIKAVDNQVPASSASFSQIIVNKAFRSLYRIIQIRRLNVEFAEELKEWLDVVEVQEPEQRSEDWVKSGDVRSKGPFHGWRVTAASGTPRADVVKPTPKGKKKLFGFGRTSS
jgi:hypothetical protein